MKKTTKLLALAMGAAMVLSLAACGGSAAPTAKKSDTVKWFNNTYAILTTANGMDVDLVGGMKPGVKAKAAAMASLEESWSVTDRETADETLDWLLTEGHRVGFAEDMDYLTQDGLMDLSDADAKDVLMNEYGMDEGLAASYVDAMRAYRKNGSEAIDAWDYCRAMSLLGWYYLAEYYTLEETLDKSLEIATGMQKRYGSWDEMAESYLDGYTYWAEEDPADPDSYSAQRKAIYEELKNEKDGCFALDWNTPLTNDWSK